MELKNFGSNVHEDSDYVKRENIKRQELAEKYNFDNYEQLRKTVKWLNSYSYHKHKMNTKERIGISMCDIWNMVEHPEIVSYNLENYVGGRFDYISLKLGQYVDQIHGIENRIGMFYNMPYNYPHSKDLISKFLNNEKNISYFIDALILANIAEDLMSLEVFYTMEYHKACNMQLYDQSLALCNFYNDLSNYIFSNTKDIVEKNTKDTDDIIKNIEDEEKRLRMEIELSGNKNGHDDKHLPKQKKY